VDVCVYQLVKKFWKSVHICQRYCQTSRDILFWSQSSCIGRFCSVFSNLFCSRFSVRNSTNGSAANDGSWQNYWPWYQRSVEILLVGATYFSYSVCASIVKFNFTFTMKKCSKLLSCFIVYCCWLWLTIVVFSTIVTSFRCQSGRRSHNVLTSQVVRPSVRPSVRCQLWKLASCENDILKTKEPLFMPIVCRYNTVCHTIIQQTCGRVFFKKDLAFSSIAVCKISFCV